MAESSNLDDIVVEQQVIERGMEDIDMDPLYKAISDNNWPAAEAFIKSHPVGLGHERMVQGWVGLPVQWAIFVGHKEMGRYLYKFTPPHLFTENHDRASSFLTLCLTNGVLDIALDLLKICKELLFAKVDFFYSTIEFIAIHIPDSSLDKSQLPFWKRWVYDYIKIPSTTTTTENLNADVQQHGENNIAHQGLGLLHRLGLQLQRELQWFKAAESMVDPAVLNLRSRMNLLKSQKQPLDHFKDNHRELRKEGVRWLENTATSCSVVGTLILTIMFAAAFTVPGGNNQNTGYPIFLEHKLFKVFLISDALSLFSSTTSILTFLGILTSHYEEEDFLYSLPKRLIIGFSTLFLSIATMTVAFSVTIIIMLQHNSSRLKAILPIVVLAGIPIISFVLLQFRVLLQVISSTYGRGTFKKKVDKWP